MKSLNLTVLTVYSYVGTSIKMMTELLNIYINIYIFIYILNLWMVASRVENVPL